MPTGYSVTLHGEVIAVGDKVWHWRLGWGVVLDLDRTNHPIGVRFGDLTYQFMTDGRHDRGDLFPSIFWDELEPLTIPPKPKKKIKKWIWAYKSEDAVSLSEYRTCRDSNWIRAQRLDWTEITEEE